MALPTDDWLLHNASEYTINGKTYRNLEAQVLKNMRDIKELQQGSGGGGAGAVYVDLETIPFSELGALVSEGKNVIGIYDEKLYLALTIYIPNEVFVFSSYAGEEGYTFFISEYSRDLVQFTIPEPLPDDGEDGQVLTLEDGEPAWKDPQGGGEDNIVIVHLQKNEGTTAPTVDMSYLEILHEYNSGKMVFLEIRNYGETDRYILPLTTVFSGEIWFIKQNITNADHSFQYDFAYLRNTDQWAFGSTPTSIFSKQLFGVIDAGSETITLDRSIYRDEDQSYNLSVFSDSDKYNFVCNMIVTTSASRNIAWGESHSMSKYSDGLHIQRFEVSAIGSMPNNKLSFFEAEYVVQTSSEV